MLDQLSLGQLLDPSAPVVTLSVNPLNIIIGESTTINVGATDNKAVNSLTLTINNLPVPLDANGQAVYTPERAGQYKIVAIASDEASNLE